MTLPKQTSQAYEEQAKAHPWYYDHNNGTVWEDAIKWLINRVPRSLVDLGCGNNELAWHFQAEDGCEKVLGIDWMDKQEWVFDAPYLKADIRSKLPLETDEYEVVTCIHVMEHLETEDQVDGLAKEMARVASRLVLLEISLVPQWFHTMIRSVEWWTERLAPIGRLVMKAEGRDGALVVAYRPV